MKSWDREREREREREKRREGRKEGRGRSEGAVLLLLLLSQSRALLCYLTQLRGKISAPKRYGGGQRGGREGVKGETSGLFTLQRQIPFAKKILLFARLRISPFKFA